MPRRFAATPGLLLLIFCASTLIAQQTDPKTSELKEITGRVVSDSGQPLAGASVSASRSGGGSGQRTVSDSEGSFRMQGLDPGFYRLFASLPGYVTQTVPDPGNPNTLSRPGDSVSLTLIKGGVISGTVTSISGDPVVNVAVRVLRVRDAEGEKLPLGSFFPVSRVTDDRGYYRIYGLSPGTYLVAAGGQAQTFGTVNPFANDALTFAPASTRDSAAELIVRAEQEVTADIRYRGEPGHRVSGRLTGAGLPQGIPTIAAGVRLIDPENQLIVATATATGEERTFQLNGVADGEYEISATTISNGPGAETSASPIRHITVKGADITGLELTLAPMASIAGRVNLELNEKLNCGRRRDNALRETMIIARRERPDEKAPRAKSSDPASDSLGVFPAASESIPNDKAEINFRNLGPTTYRFEIRLPGAGWYLRDLALGPADSRAPANKSSALNIAKNGIALKPGEKISGLTITIVEGGAGFRGRVTTGEGQSLPAGLRVYLVPAERESVDNMFRYFEGPVESDGNYAIGNIAPGKYWLIAQPQETATKAPRSIRTDGALRARILRSAEALKKEISFQPCERTVDYELPLRPVTKAMN